MPEDTEIRPSEVVTSEAPRQRISAGEVAQPYDMLARALDKAGQGLEDVATPLAEQAGYKAVTRDADGNIQVDHMPIFGRAGDAYARAVKVAALAEGEGAAKRADIELREQYRDNPQGYQQAAQAFRDKTVQQYQAAAGPEVAQSLGQAIDNTTTFTYRGLLNEKERLDLQRAEHAYSDGMADARNDLLALARQNAPAGEGSEFQAASDKYTMLANEKASNPRMAYTQEDRARDLQQLQSDIGGQRYLYHIDQTYKDKGLDAALEDAKGILTDPAFNQLKPAQRDKYYHEAVADIHASEAIRTQDRAQAHIALTELRDRAAVGDEIDPAEIQRVRNSFEALHDPAGMASVDIAFHNKDLHDAHGQLPIRTQLRDLQAIRGATAVRDDYQFFLSRGFSSIEAAGMAGNIAFESGGRTAALGDFGTSAGLAQWHADRLTALKQFAAARGQGWQDRDVQREFMIHELATTESVARGLLRTATTPEEAASIFASAYERPAGRDYSGRQAIARAVFEGKMPDGTTLGPGPTSWLAANRAATLKTAYTEQFKQIKADFDAGKGELPDRQALQDIADAARETNNVDLSAKAEQLSRQADFVERARVLPLDQQRALETELRRQMAEPGGGFEGADAVLKQLEARTQKIQEGLNKDPISTIVTNNPQLKTPEPLNTEDPRAFMTGLAVRAQIAQIGARQYGVPPLSALDEGDVQRVKAALATPDLGKRAQVWDALSTLPDAVRDPTFEKIAKGDLNARAEAGAGAMMRQDPDMAKSVMAGLEIMKRNDKGILKQFEPKSGGSEGIDADLAKFFPMTAFDSETRLSPEGNYSTTAQMIKGRYAFLAAQSNNPEYSKNLLQQSINDVTGGLVATQTGAQTIPPVRGMGQRQFDGVMAAVNDADLAGVTDLNGRPLSAEDLRWQGSLEAIGSGRYLVNMGTAQKPIYAYRNAGIERADVEGVPERFVLDLSGKAPMPQLPGHAYGLEGPFTAAASQPPAPTPPRSRAPAQPPYDPHMQPPTIGVRG